MLGSLNLSAPAAVSTSGDYERFFFKDGVRYHHIFDPRTGRPAAGFCAVTVVAPSSLVADALTKPLFILGTRLGMGLLHRYGAEGLWVRETAPGKLCGIASPGLAAKLATAIPTCDEPDP